MYTTKLGWDETTLKTPDLSTVKHTDLPLLETYNRPNAKKFGQEAISCFFIVASEVSQMRESKQLLQICR